MLYDIITAPQPPELTNATTVFLAGGISGCADWQSEAALWFSKIGRMTVFNPRRPDFDTSDPMMTVEQILWERRALTLADAILFWFSPETKCPITLFEYGYWLGQKKPIAVGTHPDYPRRNDVVLQTALVRPQLTVHSKLDTVLKAVKYA